MDDRVRIYGTEGRNIFVGSSLAGHNFFAVRPFLFTRETMAAEVERVFWNKDDN